MMPRAFGGDPEEFYEKYREELKGYPAVEALRVLARQEPVTLLFGARDEAHNEAVVLRELF